VPDTLPAATLPISGLRDWLRICWLVAVIQYLETLSRKLLQSSMHTLQALLTDMAAHSHVIEDINKMADEMIAANHSKMPAVKKRRAEINDKYATV